MSDDYADWGEYTPPFERPEFVRSFHAHMVCQPGGDVFVEQVLELVPSSAIELEVGCGAVAVDASFTGKSLYTCLHCTAVIRHDDLGSTNKREKRARSKLPGLRCHQVMARLATSMQR